LHARSPASLQIELAQLEYNILLLGPPESEKSVIAKRIPSFLPSLKPEHVATGLNPPKGKQFIEMMAKEFGIQSKYRILTRSMLKLHGCFTQRFGNLTNAFHSVR
jgi:hypothetical protein